MRETRNRARTNNGGAASAAKMEKADTRENYNTGISIRQRRKKHANLPGTMYARTGLPNLPPWAARTAVVQPFGIAIAPRC